MATLNAAGPSLPPKGPPLQTFQQVLDLIEEESRRSRLELEKERAIPPTKLPERNKERLVEKLESQLNLGDMLVGRRHEGSYLLVRTITRPHLKWGILVGIEDPSGRVETLHIAHWTELDLETGAELDGLVSIGTVLVIREPSHRVATLATNGVAAIEVDSPTDFSVLPPSHPLVTSTSWTTPLPSLPSSRTDYRAAGNAHYQRGQLRLASKTYSLGIDSTTSSSPDERLLLHLNRAQSELALKNFGQAYRDATEALQLLRQVDSPSPSSKPKALLRQARALDGLGLLKAARKAYQTTLDSEEGVTEALKGRESVEKRIVEARSGLFDWPSLFEAGLLLDKKPQLEIGSFIGSVRVEMLAHRGGGRGVVATKDIAPGELLVVEKAMIVGYPSGPSSRLCYGINVDRARKLSPTTLDMITQLSRILVDDPSMQDYVYSLYGGECYDQAAPPSAPRWQRSLDGHEKVDVDTLRLEEIIAHNSFGLTISTPKASFDSSPPLDLTRDPTVALFHFPSFFNHSCIANAAWTTFGPVWVGRATEAIRAGDEVLIPYIGEASEGRSYSLKIHFGDGGCDCQLCQMDKLEGEEAVQRRAALVEQELDSLRELVQEEVTKPSKSTFERIHAYIKRIEETYHPSRPLHLRTNLSMPYHILATAHSNAGQPTLSLYHDLKALAAVGVQLKMEKNEIRVERGPREATTYPSLIMIQLAATAAMQDRDGGKKWLKATIELERLMPSGREMFKERFAETMELLGLSELYDEC